MTNFLPKENNFTKKLTSLFILLPSQLKSKIRMSGGKYKLLSCLCTVSTYVCILPSYAHFLRSYAHFLRCIGYH